MSLKTSVVGYPRMGENRELKRALEAYWKGAKSIDELQQTAAGLRLLHWQKQKDAGIDRIPSNDFSFYDPMLDMICAVGAVPDRFGDPKSAVSPETYFLMARGMKPGESGAAGVPAMEMTKWFNTNYHYIVPELNADQAFAYVSHKAVEEFREALAAGIETVPTLIGPVTFLLLSKTDDGVNALSLLDTLLPVYTAILQDLKSAGASRVQLEEPCLALDVSSEALAALEKTYRTFSDAVTRVDIALTSYFGGFGKQLEFVAGLPVQAVHVDAVSAPDEVVALAKALQGGQELIVGVVNGRNIWKNDYKASLDLLAQASDIIGQDRVVVGTSCSLALSPVTLKSETALDEEIKVWLAFADEKLVECSDLARLSVSDDVESDSAFQENQQAWNSRRSSSRVHVAAVQNRIAGVTPEMAARNNPFAERIKAQQESLGLPLYPTTTIGSFPQTKEIRRQRAQARKGEITAQEYQAFLEDEVRRMVQEQEEVGLDVLVHGEPERNDMVEYFGEKMDGFVFTKNGWVQSYGSRCVKPPIIFGDVSRPGPMTVEWAKFAQSCTHKPMKGMLTGPITILEWSFVRDDQPRSDTARQIALAIRDEVVDLEGAGIKVIQIDEPALREGLPLKREDWDAYLEWSVECFRISASGVKDATQIHTHMCYAEFNDIIESIAALDADVISVEASRSRMELLDAFSKYEYPNQIGPGVWDIHSPRVPSKEEMVDLLQRAAAVIQPGQLWVNPDCGLKTRDWPEVRAALKNMVAAAEEMRK